MRGCSGQRVILKMKKDMQRMSRNHKMDQDRPKKDEVLNGVHRHTRPRAHIDVTVMQRVDVFVEKRDMKKTMYPVEIEALPNWDQ